MGSGWFRTGLVYLLILVAVAALIFSISRPKKSEGIPITLLAEEIKAGKVEFITVKGDDTLKIKYKNKKEVAVSHKESGVGIIEILQSLGVTDEQLATVNIEYKPSSNWSSWLTILGSVLPVLVVGALFYFLIRQAQSGSNQNLSFGKSRARMLSGDKPTVTFDDVGGLEEAKQALQMIIRFLKEPERYMALGARIPKGVLLTGPTGSGKTLLAKAVSGEAGVPFFHVNASEFIEMFVGVGAARIRDLFEQAKKNSPCIVFIDEIDSIGGRRALTISVSHEERDQAVNQLLAEIDGFDTDINVIVLGATNRPQILDPALTRPGRFDRQVALTLPDEDNRRNILEIHVRGKPLAADVDLGRIAKSTPGFSGADLEGLVNAAALLAAEANRRAICLTDFEEAKSQMLINLDDMPSPQEIHQYLDQYVIGQEFAKKVLSVAVSNHYARIKAAQRYPERLTNIKKSNVLLIGPTGTGKTLLAEAIARYLNVPFAMISATVLTETGYVGADAEYILYKLLEDADFNIRKAECGIICIDEIDKLSNRDQGIVGTGRDISAVGVQQDLLKIIEGNVIDVPKEGGRFAGNVEYYQVNTQNILFVCEGAFVGLDEITKYRLGHRYSVNQTEDLLKHVQPEDIIAYGFIPELVGRVCPLSLSQSRYQLQN